MREKGHEENNGVGDRRCGPTSRDDGRNWETLGAEKKAFKGGVRNGVVGEGGTGRGEI